MQEHRLLIGEIINLVLGKKRCGSYKVRMKKAANAVERGSEKTADI